MQFLEQFNELPPLKQMGYGLWYIAGAVVVLYYSSLVISLVPMWTWIIVLAGATVLAAYVYGIKKGQSMNCKKPEKLIQHGTQLSGYVRKVILPLNADPRLQDFLDWFDASMLEYASKK